MIKFVAGIMLIGSMVVAAPYSLQIPSTLSKKLKSFEPSASVYLHDLDLFLVASDDTTKKNDPWLFFVSREGLVLANPVVISGLASITDIESLSVDEHGFLYILCSQGLNKKGLDLKERNYFVKAERKGQQVRVVSHIELRPLILKSIMQTQNQELGALKGSAIEALDIESHFVYKGELYVGLKDPQVQSGVGLVLNLGSIQKLLQLRELEKMKVVFRFNFHQSSKATDLISDMLPLGENLFLSTTTENGEGKLWVYSLRTQTLEMVRQYGLLRPEGLAYDFNRSELAVFFDQGEDEAMMKLEKIHSRRR